MMAEIFIKIIEMSVTASFVALAVILLRLLLRRSPRFISCLLWILVALRLVCPLSVESMFSMMPDFSSVSVAEDSTEQVGNSPVYIGESGEYNSRKEITAVATNNNATEEVGVKILDVLPVVWIAGVVSVTAYGVISYLRLKKRISDSVPYRGNIRMSEKVESPFVLGFISPRIYIPFGLDRKTRKQVVAHEQAHIARRDYLTKPLAFLLVAVHWFNPVMWLCYVLLCRDIEVACDERVISDMKQSARKSYAKALLNCKAGHQSFAACPVAFGEVGVGERIKRTLVYRKPAMWITASAVVVIFFASVCLLTDPVSASHADETLPETSDVRVTQGYTEPATTAPTEPVTEPETEPVTEAPATEAPQDEYDYDYYDPYEDTYDSSYYGVSPEELEAIGEVTIPVYRDRWYGGIDMGDNSNRAGTSFGNSTTNRNNPIPEVIEIFPSPENYSGSASYSNQQRGVQYAGMFADSYGGYPNGFSLY